MLVSPGDTVIIEQDCYGGSITRLQRLGAKIVGVPLDGGGMRMDALAATLGEAEGRGRDAEIYLHHPDSAEPDLDRSCRWSAGASS
ncbi:MAG: hypothetical protein QM722_00895 [Piscinibacter sp.]